MIRIKVMADYCSSGLWEESGTNLWAGDFTHVLSNADLIALKYWHEAWEFWIAEGRASKEYIKRWNKDGQKLVDAWNQKQTDYEFYLVGEHVE